MIKSLDVKSYEYQIILVVTYGNESSIQNSSKIFDISSWFYCTCKPIYFLYYQCSRCFSYHLLHYTITANKLGQNGKWYVYNHVRYSIKLTQIGGKIPLGTTVRSYPHCSTYYCCVVLQTHINLIYIETGLKLWLCIGFLDNKLLVLETDAKK